MSGPWVPGAGFGFAKDANPFVDLFLRLELSRGSDPNASQATVTMMDILFLAYAPKNSTNRFLISSVRRSSSSGSTVKIFSSESFALSEAYETSG